MQPSKSRKLILQTLLKPEFTLTKDLNIASGYVSMNINRTPSVKMGMPSGGRSVFAKFAKVTSTSGFGYIPNGGSCFLLLEQSGCQVNIVCGDLLNAEGWQNGFSV